MLGAQLVAAGVVEVVEDVVGAAGESVQRVDGGALAGREQPRGGEEGLAVLGVDLATLPVGLAQRRLPDLGRIEFGTDHRW